MTAFLNTKTWRVMAADVLTGMRCVSHNALALLGLSAVAVVVFLAGRGDLRQSVEAHALGWLMERVTARASDADANGNDLLLAMAEPDAIARATASDPRDLSRQQMNAVDWISRRYNVAPEPIARLAQEAWSVGKASGMEPTLILAIMAIESGFNPFAQSHVGAQGLMQVMTGIHHDKYDLFGGKRAAFDPVTNLKVGVQVLQDCIRRAGSVEAGLKFYVGAANLASDGGYAAKVLAEQSYLREVVAGRKVAHNAPLPQAASPVATAEPASRGPEVRGATREAELMGAPVGAPASASAPLDAAPSRLVGQVALAG